MKRFLLKLSFLLCALLFIPNLWSQEIDKNLLNSYTIEEIEQLKTANPEQFEVLNYAIEHAVYFAQNNSTGKANYEQEMAFENSESLRFTDYGLKILDKNQYIKIKGTSKILVVKSMNVLLLEMKNKK